MPEFMSVMGGVYTDGRARFIGTSKRPHGRVSKKSAFQVFPSKASRAVYVAVREKEIIVLVKKMLSGKAVFLCRSATNLLWAFVVQVLPLTPISPQTLDEF